MTKGAMIELIRDRVQNQITVESAVFEAYVDKYLSAAINYAFNGSYYQGLTDGDKTIPGSFLGVFPNVEVRWDATRGVKKITLPAKLVFLPNDRGLVYVGPQQGEQNQFIPVGQNNVFFIDEETLNIFGKVTAQIEGNDVVLRGLGTGVNEVMVKMLSSVESYGMDEELPVPAGLDKQVIDVCVEFFLGKRQLPEEKLNDNNDRK